ncbi:MAG: Rrf2 family transcriptional regulator [Halobacteriovoraceae bacterium]|nr:Rrf2 family transcriptional regulator [Halobacteriovoraceae bacterium]
MKLTLKTDYALRILIFLQSREKATIKEIAEYFEVNKNHLSVVVNRLSELGLITSSPG